MERQVMIEKLEVVARGCSGMSGDAERAETLREVIAALRAERAEPDHAEALAEACEKIVKATGVAAIASTGWIANGIAHAALTRYKENRNG